MLCVQDIKRMTEDFYIVRIKASFMNILQKGGNKIRQIHVSAIIPECWFEQYFLHYNGEHFGDTAPNQLIFVNISANHIWTTNSKNNGNCPYVFICKWMHDTHSLVCQLESQCMG